MDKYYGKCGECYPIDCNLYWISTTYVKGSLCNTLFKIWTKEELKQFKDYKGDSIS